MAAWLPSREASYRRQKRSKDRCINESGYRKRLRSTLYTAFPAVDVEIGLGEDVLWLPIPQRLRMRTRASR